MVRSAQCGIRNAEWTVGRRFRIPHSAFRIGIMSLLDRVRALLGEEAVELAATADGVPRVAPASPDAVALLLGTAREEGWRVRIEGAGTWLPADAPADLALTTRRLDKIPAIEPQDLSATAEAGIGCDLLRQQLADRGTWLALDPPGLAGRALGSVGAPATAGARRRAPAAASRPPTGAPGSHSIPRGSRAVPWARSWPRPRRGPCARDSGRWAAICSGSRSSPETGGGGTGAGRW